MDIMELGAIGELVGGVAVIGSLIYVGLEVRQSNRHAKEAAEREVAAQFDRVLENLQSDAKAREVWLVATEGTDPSAKERAGGHGSTHNRSQGLDLCPARRRVLRATQGHGGWKS